MQNILQTSNISKNALSDLLMVANILSYKPNAVFPNSKLLAWYKKNEEILYQAQKGVLGNRNALTAQMNGPDLALIIENVMPHLLSLLRGEKNMSLIGVELIIDLNPEDIIHENGEPTTEYMYLVDEIYKKFDNTTVTYSAGTSSVFFHEEESASVVDDVIKKWTENFPDIKIKSAKLDSNL